MERFSFECMIRGYHVYKDIWLAVDGEILECRRETGNGHDPFAVAVLKEDVIVGHLPRKMSAVFSLFLRRHGTITCQVNGSRRYSSDLPQGGLEVPCVLIFSGECLLINKVKNLITDIMGEESKKNIQIETTNPNSMPPQKKCKQFKDDDEWVRWGSGLILRVSDRDAVLMGHELNDKHIDLYQKLLKKQFPYMMGLSSPLKVSVMRSWVEYYAQIYHCRNNHWIVASTFGCKDGVVNVYDSLYTDIDSTTKCQIEDVFPDSDISIILPSVQKQNGVKDCGLFAIAFATFLAFGNDPLLLSLHQFDQKNLRKHFMSCLELKCISEFPIIDNQ